MTFEQGSIRHKRGMRAEQEFKSLMESLGYNVTHSTPIQDRRDHVDFIVTKNCNKMLVDVKGVKRVMGCYTDEQTWVEVKGQHGQGWLWAKHVTHFAFKQLNNQFLIVKKEHLQEIVEEHYSNAKIVTSDAGQIAKEPKRYCYSRSSSGHLGPQEHERVILVDTRYLKKVGVIAKRQ